MLPESSPATPWTPSEFASNRALNRDLPSPFSGGCSPLRAPPLSTEAWLRLWPPSLFRFFLFSFFQLLITWQEYLLITSQDIFLKRCFLDSPLLCQIIHSLLNTVSIFLAECYGIPDLRHILSLL